MMYPVRTTLLLTVDEKTAQKYLHEEEVVEGACKLQPQPRSKLARFTILPVYFFVHLLGAIGQRLGRIA